ncbi:MAG TPA: NADH-quinone oxidoreductase subunit I [Candidatus Saccharimonadales bacterium]|nr:NADH-quinone oxidoreductase subunit I [Candidatus Saccharimonadales bacterium]
MIVVNREIPFWDRFYLTSIIRGMLITFKHLFRRKFTLRYPEVRFKPPAGYRGVPALVTDQNGREKCVACFLCEFVCPPKAIKIEAGEMPGNPVEKFPEKFDINMLRCIYCGYCEEVCPEQAIFLVNNYEVAGSRRSDLVHNKRRLYELGGVRQDPILKWAHK